MLQPREQSAERPKRLYRRVFCRPVDCFQLAHLFSSVPSKLSNEAMRSPSSHVPLFGSYIGKTVLGESRAETHILVPNDGDKCVHMSNSDFFLYKILN